jgi:hypothetical protein
MIKIFWTALVISMLAGAAFSQGKSSEALAKQLKTRKAEKVFELNYDKNSDVSKIYGFGQSFAEASRYKLEFFRFGLAFFFPGKTLASAPDWYALTFQAGGKKPLFAASHALKLTIDKEDLDIGEARYATKDIEYLNFKLTREQLSKIARGKIVRAKIGDLEFTLTPEHIKMFADLLALSDPSAL